MTYTTRQDDMLDDIVSRYYGETANGLVEKVLEANSGLAAYGPVLPAGLEITLPAKSAAAPTKASLKRLWS